MENNDLRRPAPAEPSVSRSRVITPLLGAIVFLSCFIAVGFATEMVNTGAMPLPGAPADEVYEFFSTNTTGSILTGVLQTLSVLGLAVIVAGPATDVGPSDRATDERRRRATVAVGTVAVAAMLVSAGLGIAMGFIAPSSTVDIVVTMRNASFIAGGVVHVVALGLFVLLLTRRDGWTRPVRVMGWIGGIPAVLSIVSVFWFYGSALLVIGRVLCMVCLIVAGASLLRGRTPVSDRA